MILRDTPLSAEIALGSEYIPRNWIDNVDLADVIISGEWHWSRGTSGKSENLNIFLEDGQIARWRGYWKWSSSENQLKPTSCFGDFSTELPAENEKVEKTFPESSAISTNKEFKQSIITQKTRLEVKNGKIVKVDDDIVKTNKISVTFLRKNYFGYSETNDITESIITGLKTQVLSSNKNLSVTDVTAKTTEYVVYAYPSEYGKLQSIIQDDVIQALGAFKCLENTITVTNSAGKEIKYFVYVSNNRGAFTNSRLVFK